jgi:hypothetical protein
MSLRAKRGNPVYISSMDCFATLAMTMKTNQREDHLLSLYIVVFVVLPVEMLINLVYN